MFSFTCLLRKKRKRKEKKRKRKEKEKKVKEKEKEEDRGKEDWKRRKKNGTSWFGRDGMLNVSNERVF